MDKLASDGIPLVVVTVYDKAEGFLRFRCRYCKRMHYHGSSLGHRGAHCLREDSPYLKTGYYLTLDSEEENRRYKARYQSDLI